jgi:hypothetical protein
MDLSKLRSITNSYRDVRLISLQKWSGAAEFIECDRGGPYVVGQEGYDPNDLASTPNEFILGKSGHWLPLAHFFTLPLPERRAEFVFCSAAEVMRLLDELPTKVSILRPGKPAPKPHHPEDELNATVLEERERASAP